MFIFNFDNWNNNIPSFGAPLFFNVVPYEFCTTSYLSFLRCFIFTLFETVYMCRGAVSYCFSDSWRVLLIGRLSQLR